MTSIVQSLAVQIVRFVDPSFPGWVACEFTDSEGVQHTIIDKWPIFTADTLDETSAYPCSGGLRCEVLSRWLDERGTELARITIERPVAMESTEGRSEFVVASAQLSN